MADDSGDPTPLSAKLLFGLILAMIVIVGVWLAYSTLGRHEDRVPEEPAHARPLPEQVPETP